MTDQSRNETGSCGQLYYCHEVQIPNEIKTKQPEHTIPA